MTSPLSFDFGNSDLGKHQGSLPFSVIKVQLPSFPLVETSPCWAALSGLELVTLRPGAKC